MVVTATGVIDNVIAYDGVSPFTPPAGVELIEDTGGGEPAAPGGTPGGGGGGGHYPNSAGGAGARGEVRIYSW